MQLNGRDVLGLYKRRSMVPKGSLGQKEWCLQGVSLQSSHPMPQSPPETPVNDVAL